MDLPIASFLVYLYAQLMRRIPTGVASKEHHVRRGRTPYFVQYVVWSEYYDVGAWR